MLKIFLSSTYWDLEEYRSKILDKLNSVFEGVGMERFIPKGTRSQEVCTSNLEESEIVIFLISPYYGSLIDTCVLKDNCRADDCPMKTGKGKISYTNCEYNITKLKEKLHMTYLVQKGWEPIGFLKNLKEKDIEFYLNNLDTFKDKFQENEFIRRLSDYMIEHYLKVSKAAWKFKEEIKNDEYIKFIDDVNDPNLAKMIGAHLAENILEWHSEKKLTFDDYCDRRDHLVEISQYIDNRVDVHGVGAIVKTSLIQIVL